MKVQECIILIFVTISLRQAESLAIDSPQGYPLDWPGSIEGFESSPTECDKSSSSDSSSDEDSCGQLYKYTVKNLDGQFVCLSRYAGKVLIIVNYAAECGFTYVNVQALLEFSNKYRERGLEILVFPSNDFLQNNGGNIEAKILADQVPEFEVFSEIHVNGRAQDPMYRYLKNKLPGALNTKDIKWNFTKFVIDRNGCPVQRFAATESFEDIEELVKKLLDDQYYQC